MMDPLNCIKEKDYSERISLLPESEPFENFCSGFYDRAVDYHPLDDINTCIEYDLFMQILEEHNVPESEKKGVTRRFRKGSLEYAQQREPSKMKNGINVDGAIEKRKILQEDATENEDKWPRRKRFKKGSLEYVQRKELNKIKNRIAAARSCSKVQNHILELERLAVMMRRRNDNHRKLLVHWAGPNAVGGFRPLRRTPSGPL